LRLRLKLCEGVALNPPRWNLGHSINAKHGQKFEPNIYFATATNASPVETKSRLALIEKLDGHIFTTATNASPVKTKSRLALIEKLDGHIFATATNASPVETKSRLALIKKLDGHIFTTAPMLLQSRQSLGLLQLKSWTDASGNVCGLFKTLFKNNIHHLH